jgi:hypothetical protein
LASVIDADGRAEVFATSSSGTVLHDWQMAPGAGPWSGWAALDPAGGFSSLASVINADGRAEVFATSSSGTVLHDWQMAPGAGPWSGWVQL